MIAKLVTHAPSRAMAIEAQADALDAFGIDGIGHNIPFLSALMAHPRWQEGRLSTGFIAEEYPEGFQARAPEGELVHALSAVAAVIDHIQNARKRKITGQTSGITWNIAKRRIVNLTAGDEIISTPCEVVPVDGGFRVQMFEADGSLGHAHLLRSAWKPGEPVWTGTIDADQVAMQVRPITNGVALAHRGVATLARTYTERSAALAALMPRKENAGGGKELLCPMPGLVVSIAVTAGQAVKSGDVLAIVEAMKMENVLRAERDGVVKTLHAKPGDSLAVDAVIMEFA